MKVKVSFNSKLRVITGGTQAELELPDDCAVSGLKKVLLGMVPQLKRRLDTAVIAIDHALTKEEPLIKPGMEISIFPPVVGG